MDVDPSERTEEAFLRGQQRVLEQTATGAPLSTVLEAIVRLIEAQSSDMLCSVLVLDAAKQVVRHGAAPSLPAAFNQAVDGMPIGPEEGSCGAAAYRNEVVVVDDIATHPYWRNYKLLALPLGLYACWSTPILSPTNAVLGTFAMYYKTAPRMPTEDERRWVAIATHLASIALLAHHARLREAAHLQSEAQLQAVFDHAAFGIGLITREGRFVRVNRAVCRMLGYTPEEFDTLSPGRITHPDDWARDFSLAQELLSGARDHFQVEKRYVRKDGGVILTRFTVSRVPGHEQLIIGMIEDITAQRELEQQAQKNERLEHLSRMAGVLAHDFNNVLTAIQGSVRIALEELSSHPTRTTLVDIDNATARAVVLVQRLLTFSPNAEPQRTPLRLDEIVRDAARVIASQLPERVTLQLDVEGAHWVRGDQAQLQQVVMNLATNALQAMPDGGVLSLRVEDKQGDIALSVSDSGNGIDSGVLDRIFDPFFTTRATGQGSGLGLAIVRAIVRGHEGAVLVHTALGQGSTFEVTFPRSAPPILSAPAPSNNERVLFVDDESVICRLAKRELERAGFRVITFEDPEAALAAFRGEPDGFDAIVTDASMPKLSGFDVAREVRVARPSVPIVVISGGLWNRELYDPLRIGEFLLKPQALRELGPTLRRLLDALSHKNTNDANATGAS